MTIKSATPPPSKPGKTNSKVSSIAPTGDPFVFWDNYYKTHKEVPAEFQRTVAELLRDKNYAHAEAAIKFYINQNPKQSEPWMYEWLVKTIEFRHGSPDEVKQAISYASVLAKKSRNPTDLIRVADMMVLRDFYGPVGPSGYQTNIGELVDQAAQILPTNMVPPMMSVNLAVKTKDPARLADAADRLLSLGWPGIDDRIRADLATQVNLLKQSLNDEGHTVEADTLTKKVDASRVRDLFVSLKWTGDADIDLIVEEPLGATAQYRTPRTVFGGAMLKNGYGKHPEEVYVCPRAFNGTYTIRVDSIYNDESKPIHEATLTVITQEGGADEKRQQYTVNLDKPTPVVVNLTNGRRKDVLPFIAPPEPPPLTTSTAKPGARPGPNPSNPASKEKKASPR